MLEWRVQYVAVCPTCGFIHRRPGGDKPLPTHCNKCEAARRLREQHWSDKTPEER